MDLAPGRLKILVCFIMIVEITVAFNLFDGTEDFMLDFGVVDAHFYEILRCEAR